jgi:membrane-associated protease RseP (regulator of RpoE activity)
MDWILLIIVLVTAYALVAYYIHKNKLWPEHITFYGPILAIKTDRVGFFDWFARYRTFFRFYGTIGVVMVVVVSALMTFLLILSLQTTIVYKPEPTAVNELRNIFAIPGLNDFIPLTIAVLIGLIVTMVIHEFGHAILCRVEGIRVKSMGILVPVIPIGAFVEPDEEDQERTRGLAKMRMFGAGITNNILFGLVCFALVIFLLGFAVPLSTPLLHSVLDKSPAYAAGVPPNGMIKEVNGISVSSRNEVATLLNTTKPGDTVTLLVDVKGTTSLHTLTLASWPEGSGDRTSGFMGVTYYDAPAVRTQFSLFSQPIGLLILLAIPIWVILDPSTFGNYMILINDTVDTAAWQVPFPAFWLVIQVLFWCGWWNLVVGTFNALPLIPLDGGYIMKEGIDRVLDRKGLLHYSGYVVAAVSYSIVAVILAIFILPRLFHLGAG